MKRLKNQKTPCSILYYKYCRKKLNKTFSLIHIFRYILDKLSLQAGLETQTQLTTKLEEANTKIKSLETELEELKNKEVKGEEPPAEDVAPPVEETGNVEPTEETTE